MTSPPVHIQRNEAPRPSNFNNQRYEGRRKFEKPQEREFTPLGDSLEQILALLVSQKKITELLPPSDPKSKRYDPSKRCAYHSASPGHDTQECWSLKHKIQNMIDNGEIVVEQPESPNVKANPLPEHNGGGVNAVETSGAEGPLRLRYIRRIEGEIAVTNAREDAPKEPIKLVGIIQGTKKEPIRLSAPRPLVVIARSQLPITNLKTVPWNYGGKTVEEASCASVSSKGNPLYLPRRIFENTKKENGKISEEKALEFWEKMSRGKAKMVKALEVQPPLTSIIDLALASNDHHRVLSKVLEEAHVPKSITTERFGHLVGHLLDSNVISFTDDDIPEEGRGHRKPLHISVISSGYVMNGVLIDGGSALNICPYSTLEKMKISPKRLRASQVVVRAFDGSKKDTVGEIELPVEIGPYTFDISFQVLDITASYNMLLGRPWIHMAGAVPSTLHQQIKFIVEGHLVTIAAESDYPVPSVKGMPVIHVDESAEPISYQAFEISAPQYKQLGAPELKLKVSPELTFVAREMMAMNFQPGQGLGKNSQGITEPIQIPVQSGRAGLGYHGGIRTKNSYKKIPVRITGVPIPRTNNEHSLRVVKPASEAEDKVEVSPAKGLVQQVEFLQEIMEQFERKCHLPGQSGPNEKGKEKISEGEQVMPFINWAGLEVPEGSENESRSQVAAVIEEVPDTEIPSITSYKTEVIPRNWTVQPVVSRKG